MKYNIILFFFFCSLVPVHGWGQAKKGVILETGAGSMKGPFAFVSAGYKYRWSDSFSVNVAAHWMQEHINDRFAPAVAGDVKIAYTFDVLSIIPSVFIGLGGGYGFEAASPFSMISAGIRADFMQSRTFYWGASFGGLSIATLNSTDEASTATGWFVSLRFTWIIGEEW